MFQSNEGSINSILLKTSSFKTTYPILCGVINFLRGGGVDLRVGYFLKVSTELYLPLTRIEVTLSQSSNDEGTPPIK